MKRRLVEGISAKNGLPSVEVDRLWKKLRRWPNHRGTQNMLVTHYLPIAKFAAERLVKRLPTEVDVNDLFQDGVGHPADGKAATGLYRALAKFDPAKKVSFATYACLCVRGAILDGLRDRDWTPRLVRSRVRKIGLAKNDLADRLGREPTDEEVRKSLGMDPQRWHDTLKDARAVGVESLNKKRFETDTGKSVCDMDLFEPHIGVRLCDDTDNRDLCERILRGCTDNERFVVNAYYGEKKLTMKQIAACLGLSESRVSQMHTSLVNRLRTNHTETYERTLQ
jgi:RNA polymerase sigma factor for flagellar operon FliA